MMQREPRILRIRRTLSRTACVASGKLPSPGALETGREVGTRKGESCFFCAKSRLGTSNRCDVWGRRESL